MATFPYFCRIFAPEINIVDRFELLATTEKNAKMLVIAFLARTRISHPILCLFVYYKLVYKLKR